MKEESLLLLSDLQKLINQVVLIDYTINYTRGGFPVANFTSNTYQMKREILTFSKKFPGIFPNQIASSLPT